MALKSKGRRRHDGQTLEISTALHDRLKRYVQDVYRNTGMRTTMRNVVHEALHLFFCTKSESEQEPQELSSNKSTRKKAD